MEAVKKLEDVVPILPECFSFCSLQIAGHHYSKKKEERTGVLFNNLTGHLFKPLQNPPRGKRERDFYEYIWGCNDVHNNPFDETSPKGDKKISEAVESLKRFIPKYFAVTEIIIDERPAQFLELENINGRFKKPCVVDVKIGAKTWDPLATKEKIETDIKKYPWAPILGFRFLGMKLYNPVNDNYESFDSAWGKGIAENQVVEALKLFFHLDISPPAKFARCIFRKLCEILHFFEDQKCFQFYSSSILISYEGLMDQKCSPFSDLVDQFSINYDDFVDVRMIDFTHVFDEKNVLDDNYIHGLRNFIMYMEKFISC